MVSRPYGMASLPYATMKMTMQIDDQLLDRVVRLTGADSKTEAVHLALRELDRRSKLAEFGRAESVIPGYDILEMRDREVSGTSDGRVSEAPVPQYKAMTFREYMRQRRNS
jgi:hypothetical protein